MRIAIRADASTDIGTGHVMRCLALAGALRGRGCEVAFVCREAEGDLCALIEGGNWPVFRLPGTGFQWEQDAADTLAALGGPWARLDWLIVDHYGLDARWEALARSRTRRLMSIDDLADRKHDCDLLLDQNLSRHRPDNRYAGLVAPNCRMLLGPGYALLRPQFAQARATLKARNGELRRIMIFFSGSDPCNETAKALEGFRLFGRSAVDADVVVGASNPRREEIRLACEQMPNATYHCQVENMAELMARADLAIGGAGVANWERCCVGLPSLVAVLAHNQLEPALAAAEHGAVVNLGWFDRLGAPDYRLALDAVKAGDLLAMQERALDLVDGMGCARVAQTLSELRH